MIRQLSSEFLTQGERSFLLKHADVTDLDLADEARARTRAEVAFGALSADRDARANALSTREVAELLGRAEESVRRSRVRGDLYALRTGDERGLWFPRWQFTERGVALPGMRRIISAFPRHAHPLTVERFMTDEHETLEGQSPVEWLAAGEPVETVVELVDELSHE